MNAFHASPAIVALTTRSKKSTHSTSVKSPVVSAGVLSPFPTSLGDVAGPSNDTAAIHGAIRANGWHYNVQNNIWNTNFPQFYPFVKEDTELLARFTVRVW